MSTADQVRALLRADEPAVLRAVADYLAESYVPEPASRYEVMNAIQTHLRGLPGYVEMPV